jgi:hypothetical protein
MGHGRGPWPKAVAESMLGNMQQARLNHSYLRFRWRSSKLRCTSGVLAKCLGADLEAVQRLGDHLHNLDGIVQRPLVPTRSKAKASGQPKAALGTCLAADQTKPFGHLPRATQLGEPGGPPASPERGVRNKQKKFRQRKSQNTYFGQVNRGR